MAQESWPPYKISRLFHFNYSESILYDTNVLQNEFNSQKDTSINHGLSISHSDERPYFIYQIAYSLSYRNFFKYTELNDDSHSLNAQISIQRPFYSIDISNQFSISSDPRSIEFDAFNRTTSNITNIRGEYRFNDSFKMNFSTQYDTQEYVEIPLSNSKRFNYIVSASYQFADKFTLIANYEELKSWFTGSDSESISTVMKGNISYQLFQSLSLYTGIEYTFLNRTELEDENYYSIPLGMQILLKQAVESELDNLQWLQNLSLSISTSISNRSFRNPIDFNIIASGYITQKTTWSLNASRKLDFSYLSSQQQYQTSVAFGIAHIFHELRTQIQFSYQRYEYETDEILESMDFSLSFGFPITRWIYLNGRYNFTSRLSDRFDRDYDNHRFSIGSSISF